MRYRLSKDAELFEARLDKIQGFADIAKALVAQVRAKTVTNTESAAPQEKTSGEARDAEKAT